MATHNTSFADLVANRSQTLKTAREAGAATRTELGPLIVRHGAVRALAQSDKLRPSLSLVLAQFGVSSGPSTNGSRAPRWTWTVTSIACGAADDARFHSRSVDRLRPFLAQEADGLIDELLPLVSASFIQAYARRLPAAGLCELIGVPLADRERFSGSANTIGYGFNLVLLPTKIAEVDAALVQLLAYTDELIAARRAQPQDDLVTRIAQAADEATGVDENLIRAAIAGLVFAGHENHRTSWVG